MGRTPHLIFCFLSSLVRDALARAAGLLRRKWHSLDSGIPGKALPVPVNAELREELGMVHAVLAPEGLVLVNGIVEGALWCGNGGSPRRGEVVSISYDAVRCVWQAFPPAAAANAEEQGTDTADES